MPTFPLRLPKRMDASKSERLAPLLERAEKACETFLAYNPGRRASTYIAVSWRGNAYCAYCRYTSTQGTSTFDHMYE